MKTHITQAGEEISQHLDLGQREFPPGCSGEGIVVCATSSCDASFLYGPVPAFWEYVEAAGIGSYHCPKHALHPASAVDQLGGLADEEDE